MDQQGQRGRSPSAGHLQPHIRHSPSPGPSYPPNEPSSIGLGLGLDQSPNQSFATQQHPPGEFAFLTASQQSSFDSNQNLGQAADANLSFAQNQPGYLAPSFDGDFSLFPQTTQGEFNQPLFEQSSEIDDMSSPQIKHSPTPPHLLKPEPQGSPGFGQHQFSSSPGSHSRHASLGPEAALLPNQINEWTQPQFQGHRRTPSEYSDVSTAPSPNLTSHDTFDPVDPRHSPMQRPQDAGLYQEVLGIGNFSLSDPAHSPNHPGRSPSHSPAISPRILPSQLPELNQPPAFGLPPQNHPYGAPGYSGLQAPEAFPTLQGGPDVGVMPTPAINIDFAPPNARLTVPDHHRGGPMNQDALTPPDRGRARNRPRAVTDPFNSGGPGLNRPQVTGNLSPNLGDHRSDSSRSLSPLDRQAANSNRRRQSTSAVPNNVIALRLADPDYQSSQDNGSAKRVQKHPATFQCTLCPKRFTRAYNLRSHLRTHTDERPFVCTVCGKAFARQHDRKRHESLHSGEKKFVCKGDLKAGGQWGCGRRFARADALGRHFRSEAGRICIKPLLDEEMLERQRLWQEQRIQQNMAQSMAPPAMMDPSSAYPMDPSGNYHLPAALLAQYPALAQVNWSANEMAGGMDDELSGRSSFDASDYDEGDDAGYVSGPGTGFGDGGMPQNYGDVGYASDFGQGSR